MRSVLAILCCIAATSSATGAWGGEAAARRVIGFSPDGAAFAFEEYGAGDPGMGRVDVHSFIAIFDVAANEVSDDSVSARLEGGDESLLAPLRRLTAQAAGEPLERRHIAAPGRLIGRDRSSRAGEQFVYAEVVKVMQASKPTLDVEAPEIGGKAKLVLEYDGPAPTADPNVEPSSDKSPAFAVALIAPDGRRLAVSPTSLDPRNIERGAFYRYAIAEAYLLPVVGGPPKIAVVIETFTQGAEGPDRNFIAIAFALEAP